MIERKIRQASFPTKRSDENSRQEDSFYERSDEKSSKMLSQKMKNSENPIHEIPCNDSVVTQIKCQPRWVFLVPSETVVFSENTCPLKEIVASGENCDLWGKLWPSGKKFGLWRKIVAPLENRDPRKLWPLKKSVTPQEICDPSGKLWPSEDKKNKQDKIPNSQFLIMVPPQDYYYYIILKIPTLDPPKTGRTIIRQTK